MNSSPMILRFCLGIGDARERGEEAVGRLHVHEVDGELVAEGLLDLLGLAGAHQAGVDEDAGELVADRPVHERSGDRGVDAARQGASTRPRPDLGADRLDRRLDAPRRASRSGRQPQTSNRNRLSSSWPRSVWTTSGWNCTP